MSLAREKLTARKLLALPPTLMGRLKRVAAMKKEDESEIMRRGLVAELDRIEAEAGIEAVRLAKLKELAVARGGDIDAVIDEMLRQVKEPELPGVAANAA